MAIDCCFVRWLEALRRKRVAQIADDRMVIIQSDVFLFFKFSFPFLLSFSCFLVFNVWGGLTFSINFTQFRIWHAVQMSIYQIFFLLRMPKQLTNVLFLYSTFSHKTEKCFKLFGNCNDFFGLVSLFIIKMPQSINIFFSIYFNEIYPIQSN